jgi:RNA polymerase sigma factor (sigma-70 family)
MQALNHAPSSDANAGFVLRADAAEASDTELVQRCLAGQSAAWSILVARYQRLVYAIVTRMGLDEHMAADVFQTVFVRLMRHMPRIADPSRLQAWIVTTAKREGLLQRKLAMRMVSMSSDDDSDDWDVADDAPIPEAELEDLQQMNRVREAMARLDDRSRRVLGLLFREDGQTQPYEAVALELGIPVGSIGPTRARCLEKLRRVLVSMESGAPSAQRSS